MGEKIGILLPRSDMFPTLARDFLNGFKLSLKKSMTHEFTPQFIVESVGNAADDNLLKVAEKMILQEEVDLTITFCSVFKLRELVTIFHNYKKPLIHVDLGGSVLKKEHTSPYILHHTLNLWQSAYAAGIYAAHNFGKKAAVAASFYDGGYHFTEGFVRGFTNEGGSIVNYYVGPMDYKAETFENMLGGIEESQPDVVFALFSYNEGKKIFDILAKSKLNGAIPIMAIPLMTDETINTENYQIENVRSVASWAFDDESDQMQDFLKDYQHAHENAPNIMGLLGFEVGLTISGCINSEGKIASKLKDELRQKLIDTPRGALIYNDMNESQLDTFKLRKFQFNKVKYHNTVIDTIDASFSENLYSEFENLPYSGWQNPYICT